MYSNNSNSSNNNNSNNPILEKCLLISLLPQLYRNLHQVQFISSSKAKINIKVNRTIGLDINRIRLVRDRVLLVTLHIITDINPMAQEEVISRTQEEPLIN